MSHRSAPLEVREAVSFADESAKAALDRLNSGTPATECILLSTCNRTELYFVSLEPDSSLPLVREALDQIKGTSLMRRPDLTYARQDSEAVEHLFRVASGLDSLLVGEAQIFGQVKHAYELAAEAGHAGFLLNKLMQAALRTGKRARTETAIGAGAVSVSSAAVGLAEKVFGELGGRKALLIGAGETARLAAEHLVARHVGGLVVANRTRQRAEALAETLGARVLPFEERAAELPDTDILISATSAPEVLFSESAVAEVMSRRPRRPLLIIDLAVPRDVDPAVNRLDNVFLYDVDAFETMVEQNLARRRKDIPHVEAIVREEADAFLAWYESLSVIALIRSFKEHVEAIRQGQLKRYGHQFTDEERERLDQFTRTLLNKVLHRPITRMREYAHDARWGALRMDTVRGLFGLETSNGEPDDPDRDACQPPGPVAG